MAYSPGTYAKIAIGCALAASLAAVAAAAISRSVETVPAARSGYGGLSVTETPLHVDAWPGLVHFVHRCAATNGTVSAVPGEYRLPDNDPVLPGAAQITAHFTCGLTDGRTVRFDRRLTVGQIMELFSAD